MRSKNTIKNISFSLIQQALLVVCGFIVPKLIISNFGSDVNGLISSITQFLSYITLIDSGIGQVIKAALYKPIASKDKKQIEAILKSSQKFFNLICYIFIVYIIFLCFIYPNVINTEFPKFYTASLIVIISISTFFEYYFGMIYKLFLQANQKTYVTALIQCLTIILNTILCTILIKLGANIQVVKLVSAMVYVLRPILQNIYVRKNYQISIANADSSYKLSQKWDSFSQHLATVVHNNTDVAILTLFSNMKEVSVYSVYMLVITGVKSVVQSITSGIDSVFGDMYAKEEYENLNKKFKMYEFVYYTLITIIFSCTLCLISPFICVYTKNIVDANYFRPEFGIIMVLAEFMWAFRLPYSSLTYSVGHFKQTKKGAWVEAILNILISVILVRKYNIVGVAIGTLISMVIRTTEFIIHSSKYILKRSLKHSILHFLVTVFNFMLIYFISRSIISNVDFSSYYIWIMYAAIIFAITCLLVIISNGLIFKSQLNDLVKFLKKKVIKND